MALSHPEQQPLAAQLTDLVKQMPNHPHRQLIVRAIGAIAKVANTEVDRLDWKILAATIQDIEKGFTTFHPHRHVRKISIFGSARIAPDSPEYKLAVEFARCVTSLGFMVITGGGGGIMAAGNQGATKDYSFGLNIQLPFEQGSNEFIADDDKLINFKYFFTRKLFFLRESDAIALFPGGFGTQDEAFETLTLCQTGRYGPVPLVLIDRPGGDYWHSWHQYIIKSLVERGLVSPEDPSLYTITDNLNTACETIRSFYQVYHSSRYVGDKLVLRLNCKLSEAELEILNQNYYDLLISGKIVQTDALPQEQEPEIAHLPRLVFHFNQRSQGRLYQMLNQINQFEPHTPATEHPERK
jgi:uncharacterized protein (TIGR00730 family)